VADLSSSPADYSRAFEALVTGPEDVVGHIAYSLYKANIRERVRRGEEVPRTSRNPTKVEVEAFRQSAERVLEQYGQQIIADATPQIAEDARGTGTGEIIAEIRNRTRAWPAIGYGVAAWFISILITIVVVVAAPGWVLQLASHINPTESHN
jgi:hypothetical protein